MICNEAAEYVSALYDREAIPPDAAEHIGGCGSCQQRLRDYASMGVELRRLAILETATAVPQRTWTRPQYAFASLWQKGLESMRIPRIAFGALLVAVMVMGSGWMLSKVRAHPDGTVVALQIDSALSEKEPIRCALSTLPEAEATHTDRCMASFLLPDRIMYGFQIRILGRDDDRVRLGIRTIALATKPIPGNGGFRASISFDQFDNQPQREVIFRPGEALRVETPGFPSLTLHGEWTDHMPSLQGPKNQSLDPGPEELRVVGPLLLRDKQVVGDLQGGTAMQEKPGEAVVIFLRGYGAFLISASRIEGASQASVNLNRISFEEGEHSYTFVTGAPVSRAQTVWVLHQTLNPVGQSGDSAATIGTMGLRQTSPGVWSAPGRQE